MELYDRINPNFDIPFYIFEELIDYVELSAKGECESSRWSNIECLIGLAVSNNRSTREQAKCLRDTYCREN